MASTVVAPSAVIGEDRKILPYGEKARRFAVRPPELDKRINILEGAVRSSKTWTMIPKILQLCTYKVDGHKILFGVSKQTIYNNVLSDIFDVVGEDNYSYNRQTGELNIMGYKWITIGAKDEGSEKYVRGLTAGVAVGDELTLIPESFTMMMITRMSPAGARFYSTTNPDNPQHYVKTKIIDNVGWRAAGYVFSEHFTLEDNPNLTEEYKQMLRSGYSGVFKLRYIDGLWVVAEGSIYRDAWSDELIYDDTTAPAALRFPDGHVDRWVSCDYGTAHPHVYLDMIDDGDTVWVDREYVWDSVTEMRQKTDSQYVDDLEIFLKEAQDAIVIVPPEAASFDAELTQRGIWHTDADNDVMGGIRAVATMMTKRKLRVHRRCERLLRGIPIHTWDPKKAARGIEEPIKKDDDEVDALKYGIYTKIPAWRLAA